MTKKDASSLLDYIDALPGINRRYALEGGTRSIWRCPHCTCHVEAETQEEAREKLHRAQERGITRCSSRHAAVTPVNTGRLIPPPDFR